MAMGSGFFAVPRGRMAAAAAAIAAIAAVGVTASSPAAMSCDKVAAPSGSDSAAGSAASPYRTAQKLADSLAPGQTGCLRAGLYEQDVTITKGGSSGRPVTLVELPGRARHGPRPLPGQGLGELRHGRVARPRRAQRGDLPSPSDLRRRRVFRDNDVTNYHTGDLLPARLGPVRRARRHHDRAQPHPRLWTSCPANNHEHGIYIEASDDARILENWIYDNADRGVQMFPDSQRTYIARNVIDGNGQGVSYARQSAGNVVENNVISNSVLRWNIEDWELSRYRATSRATTACGRPAPDSYARRGRHHGHRATSRRSAT